jgi:hypothetical protein
MSFKGSKGMEVPAIQTWATDIIWIGGGKILGFR